MANLTVSGICRLTRDAEIRKSTTGTWYGVGLASYRRNAKEGKQSIDFFEAEIYQKVPPPNFEKMLSKGRLIFIENGYLKNDQFVGTDGNQKFKVKIQITTFELLNDAVNTDIKVPEPPKYESKQKVVLNTTAPSDLPLPVNSAKMNILTTEEVIPEFPDDSEPPF